MEGLCIAALQILLLYWLRKRHYRGQNQRYWVHDIFRKREKFGEYHHLLDEVLNDEEKCKAYISMKPSTFRTLLELVSPSITKCTTNFRKPLSPRERLLITLRYLAAAEYPSSLSFHFRAGISTVREIVKETCVAIWTILQPRVMPEPDAAMWIGIAEDFNARFQFPMCIGSLDGKHIRIKKPDRSGSKYYNYKGYFSIILLAAADADGKFIMVDIGSCGGNSDARVFSRSSFGKRLSAHKLSIPPSDNIPGTDIEIPYLFVADDAFPLTTQTMKPFSHRQLTHDKELFNYRLSRARNSVECAFGKLTAVWRILHRNIEAQPKTATDIVKAITVLHNFLIIEEPDRRVVSMQEDTVTEEEESIELLPLRKKRKRSAPKALEIREILMNYFLSDVGGLSWQDKTCFN